MEIPFRYRLSGPENRFRLTSYTTAAPPTMCCDDMAAWWDHIVGLGVKGFPQVSNVCAVIVYRRDYSPQAGDVESVVPIRNCPWCGEKITLVDDEGVESAPETQAEPVELGVKNRTF